MVAPGRAAGAIDEDDLPIDGELLTESDLIDNVEGLMDVALPDGVDQEWLLKALWDDLRRGEHAEAVLAEAEMARVIKLNQQLEHRTVDGMGQLVARIPLSVYLHWTARYGDDFFRHKDSLDFLVKRAGGGRGNPGFLVETKMKPMIQVDGFKTRASGGDDAAGGVLSEVKPAGAQPVPAVPSCAKASEGTARRRGPVGKRGRWALAR